MKKEIIVEFKTVTPLWTGDAWGNNSEIKPSAIMGSLRFWFETIMYFAGILEKKDFNLQSGRFEKEVDRGKLQNFFVKHGNSFEEQIQALLEQEVPISSIVFGTTNWRSLIEIKKIEPIEDYCFGNRLYLPNKICINKLNYEIKEDNECPSKSNRDWSVFFFVKPYFYGKFKVTYLVEEQIVDSIFYPLLTFMDKYGFWGGKWNIGYGRLKVENVRENGDIKNRWQKSDFEMFDNICFSWDELHVANDFNGLFNEEKKIKVLEYFYSENSFEQSVIELIKLKMQKRAKYREDNEFRHKVFGSTKSPPKKDLLPQGSKILLYIDKTRRDKFPYIYGLLSITGLLNLEGESNG